MDSYKLLQRKRDGKSQNCVEKHKDKNISQRTAFKETCFALDHEAILLMDFKENLKLGGCPREISSVFYSNFKLLYYYHKTQMVLSQFFIRRFNS